MQELEFVFREDLMELKLQEVKHSEKVESLFAALRANIDYAIVEAHTTYGIIGIKVWIFDDKK